MSNIQNNHNLTTQQSQLILLLELMCEARLTAAQTTQLEALVLASNGAKQLYLEYISLHGSLHWDTAISNQPATGLPQRTASTGQRSRFALAATVACAVIIGVSLFLLNGMPFTNTPVANNQNNTPSHKASNSTTTTTTGDNTNVVDTTPTPGMNPPGTTHPKLPLVNNNFNKTPSPKTPVTTPVVQTPPVKQTPDTQEQIIARINSELALHWQQSGVTPSPVAEESEWLRRVYLDVVGHIAPATQAQQFLATSNTTRKRSALLNRLLNDENYIHNWTTIWCNLLVGRTPSAAVNREALQRFLHQSLAENRPWSHIVQDLVSAEGNADDNGAANFLLAHLNNEAVPATAITSRLFLGVQVQCMQCHNHPYNDWTQNQFWELNSFFMQTATKIIRKPNPRTGKTTMVQSIVNQPIGGPISFENRKGVMRVAFPKFNNVSIDSSKATKRRSELARLLTHGDKPLIAKAFVNRMWHHFFGYAFVNPIDDMGPHNTPTHPELLDYLTREFVLADYDVQKLIRWICLSDAYQLSSRIQDGNTNDQPELGDAPLFSRMYVKSMSPEQVFDSLLVATRSHINATQSNWNEREQQRRAWLEQFVTAYRNEENNEQLNFAGTIPQALMMMNGQMMSTALDAQQGTLLHAVIAQKTSVQNKLQHLCMATLNRKPTAAEEKAYRGLLRSYTKKPRQPRLQPQANSLQDFYWAYLNSNEFTLIY